MSTKKIVHMLFSWRTYNFLCQFLPLETPIWSFWRRMKFLEFRIKLYVWFINLYLGLTLEVIYEIVFDKREQIKRAQAAQQESPQNDKWFPFNNKTNGFPNHLPVRFTKDLSHKSGGGRQMLFWPEWKGLQLINSWCNSLIPCCCISESPITRIIDVKDRKKKYLSGKEPLTG